MPDGITKELLLDLAWVSEPHFVRSLCTQSDGGSRESLWVSLDSKRNRISHGGVASAGDCTARGTRGSDRWMPPARWPDVPSDLRSALLFVALRSCDLDSFACCSSHVALRT